MPKVGGTSLRRIHAGPTVAKKGLEANASKPTGMPCSFSNVTVDSLPGLPESYTPGLVTTAATLMPRLLKAVSSQP